MKNVKYVFVILVYRNTKDLEECLASIKDNVNSYAVVVVNAFYSKEINIIVESIAKQYQCDLINIENKGYSFGNNQGIKYATDCYDFEYLVVSNPDIIIESFDDTLLISEFNYDVVAPRITTLSGKLQNPMSIKKYGFAQKIQYIGFKLKLSVIVYFGILLSKMLNWFYSFKLKNKPIYKIYEAHGSFVILKKTTINKIFPIYDENMFLFAEEGVLAHKVDKANLSIYYYDFIRVQHKEDGSMKLGGLSINEELRKSNIYFHEHYN